MKNSYDSEKAISLAISIKIKLTFTVRLLPVWKGYW